MASEEARRLFAASVDGGPQGQFQVISDMAKERLEKIATGGDVSEAFISSRQAETPGIRSVSPLEASRQREAQPGELPVAGEGPQPEEPFVERFAAGAVRGGFNFLQFLSSIMPSGTGTAPVEPGALEQGFGAARDATLRGLGLPEEAEPGDFAGLLGEESLFAVGGPTATAINRGRKAITAARLGGEAVASVGSAGGRTAAQETGADSVLLETGASLGGAVAPLSALGSLAKTGKAASRFRKGPGGLPREEAIEEARKIIDRNLHPAQKARAIRSIEEAQALEAQVPDFRAPSGGASGDPNLQALQDDILRDVDPGATVSVGEVEQARIRSASAVSRALRAEGPPPGRTPVEVARTRARDSIEQRINDLDTSIGNAAEALGGDPATFSVARRDELAQMHLEWDSEVNTVYDDLDAFADASGIELPAEPLLQAVEAAKGAVGGAERPLLQPLQPLLASIRRELTLVDKAGNAIGTKPLTFEFLRSVKRRINKHYSDGDAPPRALAKLFGGVDESRGALRGIDADLDNRFRQADAYFEEGSQRFREGIAGRVFSDRASVPDSSVMDLYLVQGNKGRDAALEYRRSFGETPEADANMTNWIVAKAANQVAAQEGYSPARLRTFLSRHQAALEVFPEARKRVQNIQQLANSVDELGVLRPKNVEMIQRGAAALFVEDPPAAMRAILRLKGEDASRAMQQLMRRVGTDPQARIGLQRVFQDVLEAEAMTFDPSRSISAGGLYSGRPELVNGPKLRFFVDQHERSIDTLFGAGHTDNLRRIAVAAEVAGNFPAPQVSGKAREIGRSPIEEVARSGALARIGRTSIRVIRTALNLTRVSKRFGREAGERIIRESILDNELAKVILAEGPLKEHRIRQIMTARGVTLPGRVEAGIEERRVKSAEGGEL